MDVENPEPPELSIEQLLRDNQALKRELEVLKQQRVYYWELYADTSLKLQLYSASIKAAVSSLLNYDIFWDNANQHEFLETINSSVNQVSELIVLLSLAFRGEAGSLVLKRDPQVFQEILLVAVNHARLRLQGLSLEVSFPDEGKLVLVDYEYLSMILVLLLEVFNSKKTTESISITAIEGNNHWFLDFSGFDRAIMKIIEEMHQCKTHPTSVEFLSQENILKLHIACEILHLQEIFVEILEPVDKPPTLRLWVPAITES